MIPLFKVYLAPKSELLPAIEKTIYAGRVAYGPTVIEFESQLSSFFKTPNVLALSSGTAALHLALKMCQLEKGDEVISSPMTAEPTNVAICHAGGKVVWADVDPMSGNLDPESVARSITPKTKAIVVVHYGGVPARLSHLQKIARENNLFLIEDCAHAFGAKYDGDCVGTQSDFGIYSFQAIKHLTTVDGGAILFKDSAASKRLRQLRFFGIDRDCSRLEADVSEPGYKYEMNSLTASIGMVQLLHIREVLDRHISNANYFTEQLQGVPGLKLGTWEKQASPTHWFFTVFSEQRDELQRYLKSKGIESGLVHKRNDEHSLFKYAKKSLPGLDQFYSTALHIPCGWWVTPEDRSYIAETIKEGW